MCSILSVLCIFIFSHITCTAYADFARDNYDDQYSNDNNEQRLLTRKVLDTAAIYEGVLAPENIIAGVIQNFINFFTSTIGWALILPFYQVLVSRCWFLPWQPPIQGTDRHLARVRREGEDDSSGSTSLLSSFPFTPAQVSWILGSMADTAQDYGRYSLHNTPCRMDTPRFTFRLFTELWVKDTSMMNLHWNKLYSLACFNAKYIST